jgi:hypothetical protein
MARNIEYYNQADHSVIVDGIPMVDIAEGESIGVEFEGDRVTVTHGFDGASTSYSSDRRGAVTVVLKPTSISNDFLEGLFQRQSSTPRKFDVVVLTGVRELWRATGCSITRENFLTGGAAMSGRTFRFPAESIGGLDIF